MVPANHRLIAIVSWIAAVIATIVAVALPLSYFVSAKSVLIAVLDTEVEINARITAQVVQANPALWRFQTAKLEEFLKRRPRHGEAEVRRVVDLDGKTIAESAAAVATPIVWSAADVMDSGVKVGELRIARSLMPLIWRSALVGLFSALLGAAIFVVLRVLPLRALRHASDENAKLIEGLRQREDELARVNRGLEEREVELSRSSNEELQQFAYVASHDLQEPLRMITSYMGLLSRRYQGKLGADADEFIGFAVDGAKRMQGLIKDLLSYSRVGSKAKEHVLVDCGAVLANTLKMLEVVAQEAAATITHDALPTVLGDESQLGQLLQNLIGNGLKYRDSKPPVIHIGVAPEDDGLWRFAVRDNGIGIDAKDAERVFVIFQRLHSREEYSGTGIGLAVCKKIVERHGGRIWLESALGKGSTFYFTLPMGLEQSSALAQAPNYLTAH